MEELKQLVEDFVEYTRTWSISETEWYFNVDCARKNTSGEKYITHEEFERAIREEILYEFVYNIGGIKRQLETDLTYGYESEHFDNASIEIEKKIQKIFKDFEINREEN